jgi:hypothetical protein
MSRPDALQLSALDGFATRKIWRRERDSNPRYGFPYSGFQDRLFQPLTHPSASYK